MPRKVRLFSASFNNAFSTWDSTLPAASKDDFIRMYGNSSTVRLNEITIKNLGFFDVELLNSSFEPSFYIPELQLSFDSEKIGYSYLIRYFSQWTNQLRNAENEFYRDQDDQYGH